MTLAELRQKHPRFIYEQATWQHSGQTLAIQFQFRLEPDVVFTPSLTVGPIDQTNLERASKTAIDHWVFQLGIIELFSYWKAAAPGEIVVKAGYLDTDQLAWWRDLLIKSMGEFFYTNQLDFTPADFVKFSCEVEKPVDQLAEPTQQPAVDAPYLVPVGGGKDSALLIELLEENSLPYDILLSYPQSPAAQQIAKLSHAGRVIEIKRAMDSQLLALNQAGYLNGHTPFSARLAFEASLVALLYGQGQVLVANEYSANEGNVPFHGATVNHQYSKTFAFEQAFRLYTNQYLSPAPEYLSALRPIYELQIAALFARYPRFHQPFKSCNRNQQVGTWCGECAKCLFVFTVLYPFLKEEQLIGPIFQKNLFENSALNPLTLALLGKDQHKPFECVGTYQETLAAFYLSAEHYKKQHPDQALPPVLKYVDQVVLSKETNLAKLSQDVLCFWQSEHNLDAKLEKIVKEAQKKLCQ
jgi:hypothetical protein